MAYLHLIHNPLDEVNLGRVINTPPRGIGAKTMQDLVRWSQEQQLAVYDAMQQIAAARFNGEYCPAPLQNRAYTAIANFATTIANLVELSQQVPVVDLIDRVLEDSGLARHIRNSDDRPEERWENIMELRETAQEFNAEAPGEGLGTLLERLSLVAEVDTYEEANDSITLITLHQAKGLEFPVVFIVGLEEGLLPHSRSMDSPAQLEEERRLCYVGVTRAEQRLYLLRAFRRGFMGNSGPTIASRFLRELPSEHLGGARLPTAPTRRAPVLADRYATAAASAPAPTPRQMFQTGDLVSHKTFGEGVVMECVPSAGDYEVTIEFSNGVGLKRLLLSYAPLEKVEG
jgi:DNA helicase-2/ATP-dependent DNA helicase PcrA